MLLEEQTEFDTSSCSLTVIQGKKNNHINILFKSTTLILHPPFFLLPLAHRHAAIDGAWEDLQRIDVLVELVFGYAEALSICSRSPSSLFMAVAMAEQITEAAGFRTQLSHGRRREDERFLNVRRQKKTQ